MWALLTSVQHSLITVKLQRKLRPPRDPELYQSCNRRPPEDSHSYLVAPFDRLIVPLRSWFARRSSSECYTPPARAISCFLRATIRSIDGLANVGRLCSLSTSFFRIVSTFTMFRVPLWKSMLFLSALLLGSTLAGRLDEVARRKGFHPNAVRDLHAAKMRERAAQSKAKPRYLNANTKSTSRSTCLSFAAKPEL